MKLNKKILIGSIIAVAMLLLMPSIQAIQIDSFKEGIQQNIDDLKTRLSNIESLIDLPEHFPLLFLFTYFVSRFRLTRFLILANLSTEPFDGPPGFKVIHPLIFIRCVFLIWGFYWWCLTWEEISNRFGWGWFD